MLIYINFHLSGCNTAARYSKDSIITLPVSAGEISFATTTKTTTTTATTTATTSCTNSTAPLPVSLWEPQAWRKVDIVQVFYNAGVIRVSIGIFLI